MQDSIGRKWQCSTIQLDFNLPARFEMEYVDRENTKQQPIMIHRAIFGSIERFFGILTEDCAGAFSTWLAPVQCRLLPVNSGSEEFCSEYVKRMKAEGIRAEMVRPAPPGVDGSVDLDCCERPAMCMPVLSVHALVRGWAVQQLAVIEIQHTAFAHFSRLYT